MPGFRRSAGPALRTCGSSRHRIQESRFRSRMRTLVILRSPPVLLADDEGSLQFLNTALLRYPEGLPCSTGVSPVSLRSSMSARPAGPCVLGCATHGTRHAGLVFTVPREAAQVLRSAVLGLDAFDSHAGVYPFVVRRGAGSQRHEVGRGEAAGTASSQISTRSPTCATSSNASALILKTAWPSSFPTSGWRQTGPLLPADLPISRTSLP